MKPFEFPIYGFECDEYCNSIIDRYGENSTIVRLLDENFERLVSNSNVYTEQLNAVRKFLWDSGFNKEIKDQDKIFLEAAKNRQRKKPTPLFERWKADTWK